MQYLAELVISGLAIGAIYGLIAMAYAFIYKATGVVNFAQGEVMMLITYVTMSTLLATGWPFWTGLVLAPLIGVVVGVIAERLVIRPMLGQPPFAIVMATIGLSVLMRSLIVLFWGSEPKEFPGLASQNVVDVFGIGLYPAQLIGVMIFALAAGCVWLFLRYSRLGTAMRATAISEQVAMLMGVDVRMISSLSWAGAAALSGLAGVLFALTTYVGPDLFIVGLKAFPATILGGLDAVTGSAIGGLIIGVTENVVGGYVDTSLKEIAGFIVIILMLMVKPNGLFGERDVERV
jgi:branched-chain amino acid transport system permease protein